MPYGGIMNNVIEQRQDYDEYELFYDLQESSENLLEELVRLRHARKLTQQQLGDRLGVTQAYISKIENGEAPLTDLLIDYAAGVGARLSFGLEKAEEKPLGNRQTPYIQNTVAIQTMNTWEDKSLSIDEQIIKYSPKARRGSNERPKETMVIGLSANMRERVVSRSSSTSRTKEFATGRTAQ